MSVEVPHYDDLEPASMQPTLLRALVDFLTRWNGSLLSLRDELSSLSKKVSGEKRPRSSLAAGILLDAPGRSRLVFNAFVSSQYPDQELDQQFLPTIGMPYPCDEQDVVRAAASCLNPLYLVRTQTDPKFFDCEGLPYRSREYLCYDSLTIREANEFPPKPSSSDRRLLLFEPNPGTDAAIEGFFERLLLAAVQVRWPFSDETITSVVLFSVPEVASIPHLIFESSIRFVLVQFFFQAGLRQTSLACLDPLVTDLLIKSWIDILSRYSETTDLNAMIGPKGLLFRVPDTFALMAVLRQFLQSVRFSERLGKVLLDGLPALLQSHGSAPVASALVAENLTDTPAYQAFADSTLALLSQSATQSTPPDSSAIALANASAFLPIRPNQVGNLGLRAKGLECPESRTGAFGIMVARLFMPFDSRAEEESYRSSLFSLVQSEPDRDLRHSFAACVVSVLAQKTADESQRIRDALQSWDVDNKTLLEGQLSELEYRRKSRPCKSQIFGVFSQKGGVGKSTVALATAAILSDRRVCVIELDFGGPTFAHYVHSQKGLYLNGFLDRYTVDTEEWQRLYAKNFRGKLPDFSPGVTVWAADPSWEAQILATFGTSSSMIACLHNEHVLDDLVKILSDDFEVIIFDTPAELKDITRSLCTLLAQRRGFALLVASLFVPALAPLLEQYWRLLAIPGLSAALVLNRIRPLDLQRVLSADSLRDSILSNGPLHAFGLDITSPALLRTLLASDHLPLIKIQAIEDLLHAGNSRSYTAIRDLVLRGTFSELSEFVRSAARPS